MRKVLSDQALFLNGHWPMRHDRGVKSDVRDRSEHPECCLGDGDTLFVSYDPAPGVADSDAARETGALSCSTTQPQGWQSNAA